MDKVILFITLALSALMVVPLYCAWRGPTMFDRVLAVNVIGAKSIIIIILMGIIFDRVSMFIDIALAYGLLNFIASLAVSRYAVGKNKASQGAPTLKNGGTHDS